MAVTSPACRGGSPFQASDLHGSRGALGLGPIDIEKIFYANAVPFYVPLG